MSQATATHVVRQRSVKSRSGTVTAVAELAPQTLDLTDDQREIQALAREFARTEIRPVSAEVDERDTYTPLDVVYKAAEVGLTSYMLPEHVGGGGIGDVLTGCIVQEELNWGCAGIGNLITSGAFFAPPGDRGRHARPAAALAGAAVRAAAAADLAGLDRARRRLRHRRHGHHRRARRRRSTS